MKHIVEAVEGDIFGHQVYPLNTSQQLNQSITQGPISLATFLKLLDMTW